MARLFGAQRMVLQAITDLPKNPAGFVADQQVAQSTKIALSDVRDWIETLEGEGYVEVAQTEAGLTASITAQGRLALKQLRTSYLSVAPVIGPPPTQDLLAELEEYLTDDRRPIRLNRLIQRTTEEAYKASLSLHERHLQLEGSPASCAEWLAQYDSMMKSLLSLVIHGCHWGEARHIDLWVRCIERMASILEEAPGFTPGLDLRTYPATLVLYGGGIASIAAGRYDTLVALFHKSQVTRWAQAALPAALVLHGSAPLSSPNGSYSLDDFMRHLAKLERRYTPTSDHLIEVLRETMRDIEPDDYKYDALFDRFECLLALTVGHIQAGPVKRHPHIAQARPTLPSVHIRWPVGRFGWRRNNNPDMLNMLAQEQRNSGTTWAPLASGMFDGDSQRFSALLGALDSRVKELHWQ